MSNFLRGMLDKVFRAGARGAEAIEGPTSMPKRPPRPSNLPPPPPRVRITTPDGKLPQSPGDIDPKLLQELYRVGPLR